MSTPILYSFRRCPYAIRARLALQASGVEVELREIVLADKPQALLQASAKGTVPVLVLTDGRVLEQSLNIMGWALQQHDPLHWLPRNDADWNDVRYAIDRNDGMFKQALDRYKYPSRLGLADGLAARSVASGVLREWEQRLQRQTFLSGAAWGLLDAALAPFVRQFAHVDAAWFAQQQWPRLALWLRNFEDSAAFADVMLKVPVWKPEGKPGDAPDLPDVPGPLSTRCP
jgi:glutathione S-transferase